MTTLSSNFLKIRNYFPQADSKLEDNSFVYEDVGIADRYSIEHGWKKPAKAQ